MKNLELKNLGVEEMSVAEMTKVNGGGMLVNFLNELLANVSGSVNSVSADLSTFLSKTLENVKKFVWGL